MASSKSAFKLCLPSKSYDIFMDNAKDPELFNVKCRIDKEKWSPLRILIDCSKTLLTSKKELENQSSHSVDDTTSSTIKMIETKKRCEHSKIKIDQEYYIGESEISDFMAENKHLIKPKKFGERPDVIYKTILRSFKKYYLNEFNELTDFRRKKRRINSLDILLEHTNEYINLKITDNPYEDLGVFIVALIQPKVDGNVRADSKLIQLSSIVKDVLYRFNKSKMNDLLSYPQFSFILKKFLNIPNLLEFIGDKSSSPQAAENLAAQIDFLEERCDEILTRHASSIIGECMQKFEISC